MATKKSVSVEQAADRPGLFIVMEAAEIARSYDNPESYAQCVSWATDWIEANDSDAPLFILQLVDTVKVSKTPVSVTPTVLSDYEES